MICEDFNGFDDDAPRCVDDAIGTYKASAVLNRPDLPDRERFVPAHAVAVARCEKHAREFATMCARMYPGRDVYRGELP